MTPEFIAIIALGLTLIGLLLTFRRDARAENQALRADTQALRAEFRADNQRLRAEVNAGLANVQKDVQALTERVSRLEGVIEGLSSVAATTTTTPPDQPQRSTPSKMQPLFLPLPVETFA